MPQWIWDTAVKYQNGLFATLLVVSVALAGFAGGTYVAEYRVFPYYLMRGAASGAMAIYRDFTGTAYDSLEMRVSQFVAVDVPTARVSDPGALTARLLWPGGEGLFRDICPERGCLAVEFSSSGEVVHAYPYRLDELNEWEKIVERPRGSVNPIRQPKLFKAVHAARRYSNGDLLLVFGYANSFPWKGGVARIDREGMPVWVREDYSHHWPTIFTSSDGEELALVPGTKIENVPVNSRLKYSTWDIDVDCQTPGANEVDYVTVLGRDGEVLQDIRIIDQIIESPFSSMLFHSIDACDVLHLNYIDRIREDVHGIPGVSAGDYVVSLRSISAFGIMDSETGQMKHMIRGSFALQHSVQHLKGSKFILFDNHGADSEPGPSRILLVDLAGTVVRERTIYPLPDTPDDLRFYSPIRGNVSISQDRERIILVSSNQGLGLEVRLSDGAVLNVFRNIHDLTGLKYNLEEAGDRAIYLVFNDLQYVE